MNYDKKRYWHFFVYFDFNGKFMPQKKITCENKVVGTELRLWLLTCNEKDSNTEK